jgi:glycerol-3-phosphate dehydrogenase
MQVPSLDPTAREMIRDLDALSARPFDLLVIGGGICGLMAAWDASTRGLRVALIERHDFGGGASFNHHRTLHGGLRYLQSADLLRLRESVRERRLWARIAPHLIAPQQFAVEADGARGRNAVMLRAGLLADAWLTADRNAGIDPSLHLPSGRVVSGADREGIDTGELLPETPSVAVWSDYRTEHAERLTLAVALAASRAGAILANYVDAIEPIREHGRIAGMIVRNGIDGARLAIKARVTINAAGAGAGRVMAAFGVRRSTPLVKAMNVVTKRPAPPVACGAPASSGRLLFTMPWQKRLSIGTWHGSEPCGADAGLVTPQELGSFIDEINESFPSLRLGLEDITLVQRGIVPARIRRGRMLLADRPLIREHRRDGVDGAVTVMGVKYTTARAAAEYAVTLALAQMGGDSAPPRIEQLRLPGSVPNGTPPPSKEFDREAWEHLQRIYGPDADRIAASAIENPRLGERITPSMPIIGAQIVEAVRNEMALTLEDVVLRRTGLGAAGYPGDEAILNVERLMREQLAWTSSRVDDEVRLLKEFYLPIHV